MRIVLFDLETGGVEDHHPNIQLAAAAVEVKDATTVHLHGALDLPIQFDEDACDPEALRLNSYNRERWEKEAIPEGDALKRFIGLCRDHSHLTLMSKKGRPYNVARLGGHNVQTFDVPRLQAMGARHGDPFLACCWWYPLDTYQGTVWHFARAGLEPPANYQLGTLAKHFDLPEPTHDAMADLRTTGYLLARLLHG